MLTPVHGTGGSVVQFARGTEGDGMQQYAFKFFVPPGGYKEEELIYKSYQEALRKFMPEVVKYGPNTDGAIKDPFGNPLPPFIAMEKGESLRDHMKSRVDVFTAAQVLLGTPYSFCICCFTCDLSQGFMCGTTPFSVGATLEQHLRLESHAPCPPRTV